MAKITKANTEKQSKAVETAVSEPTLNELLARMESLEAENKKLQRVNVHKEAKKINDDPKQFNYKLRGWVPVLSFTSKRKDPTKDLLYKNQFWSMESNHVLVLKLADGNEEEVEVTDFNSNFTRSEKQEAKIIDSDGMIVKDFTKLVNYGGVEDTQYVFTHPVYWEITVLYSAIN